MQEGKPPPSNQRWRTQMPGADPAHIPVRSRQKQVFALLAVMLALSGLILAWLLYVRPMPTPFFLSLPIREYTVQDFPVNAMAVQDSDLLLQHFPEDKRQKAYESQNRERLRLELQKLRTRSDGAVVVHLCALARGAPPSVAEEKKEAGVFVLPGDADPGDPNTWVPLAEALKALRECPAPHKLLLLDIMRPLADPRLGILTDDIGTQVQEMLEKETLNDLWVLCACGKGEMSLVSDNLKQSTFAYFLDLGLRGSADGLGSKGNADRRVTVTELAAYVHHGVDHWARHNRGTTQKPVLLGQGEDFPLVHLDQGTAEFTPVWEELKSLPAWINSGWELRDKWWDDGSFRLAPRLFRELENLVLRAEQRWLGGIEEARLKNELESDLKRLTGQMKKAQDLPRVPLTSLALNPDSKKAADAALEDALRDLLVNPGKVLAKPGDLEKTKASFKEKFKAHPTVPLAWKAWELAGKLPSPSPLQIFLLVELVHEFVPEKSSAEMVFLERLLELRKRVEENEWAWPAEAVRQNLRTFHQAEQAIANLAGEPFALVLVEPLFEQAEKGRREAEKGLFFGRPSGWEQATNLSRQAELVYLEILRRLENLRQARKDFDEATVLLPGYVPFLVKLADAEENSTWKSAIQAGERMADLLLQGKPDASLGEVKLDQNLRISQANLERSFTVRWQRFLNRVQANQGNARDYLDGQIFFASPRLTVSQRDTLWKASQTLAYQLHKASWNTTQSPVPPVTTLSPSRLPAFSIDLLRLGGLAGVEPLEKKLDKKDLPTLGEMLRETWGKKLPLQLLENEQNLARADRLSRILPFAHGKIADPTHWSFSPATLQAHNYAQAFLRWLGNRYRTESRQFPEGSPPAIFYAKAAEECLR